MHGDSSVDFLWFEWRGKADVICICVASCLI